MDFVDNVLDPNSGTVRGRARLDNSSFFLTPGVFGRMRLFGGRSDALLVPDGAILSDQARKIVLTVAEDGTVGPKIVTTGPPDRWPEGRALGPRRPATRSSSRAFSAPAPARK